MTAYFVRLREIATALRAACSNHEGLALRIEATRLRQWVDDAASTQVDPHIVTTIGTLTNDLERLVLATVVDQAALVALIALLNEVVTSFIATTPTPTPTPSPAPTPRRPFWKRGSR